MFTQMATNMMIREQKDKLLLLENNKEITKVLKTIINELKPTVPVDGVNLHLDNAKIRYIQLWIK